MYNPNTYNKKRLVKRKNLMSLHHPNFDRSQCLREAEGHDRARSFYTLETWLSAFRSADLWVSDMSDLGAEHGGSSSPPLQGGDPAGLRLGAFGFFGTSRQTMLIFWTLFVRFKNVLGYVFGMRPYVRDELEVRKRKRSEATILPFVTLLLPTSLLFLTSYTPPSLSPRFARRAQVYLGQVGWYVRTNLRDPTFEAKDSEVWRGADAARRFGNARLNQLLVDGYHLHLYRELEECAFENGDVAMYGFVLTKR